MRKEAALTISLCFSCALPLALHLFPAQKLPAPLLVCDVQLLLVTSQVFAGHMGTEQLAAVALSNSM